jgi:uncharacterized protein
LKVLCDTSGLFAALAKNDENHVAARPTLEQLLSQNDELHLSSYGVVELTSLLQRRVGLEAARAFNLDLLPLLRVTWVDAALHERAFDRLRRRARRQLSLVDCSHFILMERLGIERAFTFDADYLVEGFQLIRSPADLRS